MSNFDPFRKIWQHCNWTEKRHFLRDQSEIGAISSSRVNQQLRALGSKRSPCKTWMLCKWETRTECAMQRRFVIETKQTNGKRNKNERKQKWTLIAIAIGGDEERPITTKMATENETKRKQSSLLCCTLTTLWTLLRAWNWPLKQVFTLSADWRANWLAILFVN